MAVEEVKARSPGLMRKKGNELWGLVHNLQERPLCADEVGQKTDPPLSFLAQSSHICVVRT